MLFPQFPEKRSSRSCPESPAAEYPSVDSKLVETRRPWPLAAPATVIVSTLVLGGPDVCRRQGHGIRPRREGRA